MDLLIRENAALIPVEIKSAATFSPDFVKGLERFRSMGIKRVMAGAVLFNGGRPFEVRGVRAFNPLRVEDVWRTLTGPPVKDEG
ncbi:MAG: hypothetical protein M5R36_10855 [Deltaproteobacteria bacterium]|nr:hypothetical protein [Deltaproteobacteria bacterium]